MMRTSGRRSPIAITSIRDELLNLCEIFKFPRKQNGFHKGIGKTIKMKDNGDKFMLVI